MPQQISFPNIPANLRIPLFWADWGPTTQPGPTNQRSLIIGQTLTAQPNVPVIVASVAQAKALFGAGSMLAAMVQKYRKADPLGFLLVLPFADAGGGVKATGSIAFTGPATAAGVLSIYIAGRLVQVAVANGDTAATIAANVIAAINAYRDKDGLALPVTALIDGVHNYQVDLTAQHAGTAGNSIDVRMNYFGSQNGEATPAGLTVAIVAMSTGAGDPDLTGLDPILGDDNYDFIAIPYSTSGTLNALQVLLNNATGRWSYLRADYGGVFAAKMDADASGATNLGFGATRNDPYMTVVSYEPSPPPPWDVAASWCGAAARSAKADPARPLQTLSLPDLLAPPSSGRYTKATQQAMLTTGLALMQYNPDGTCAILRCVTTYQLNPSGAPDISYLDKETTFTLMAVIRFLKGGLTTAFPRAKLVGDGTSFGAGTSFENGVPDVSIVTPKIARAKLISLYMQMVDLGWTQDVDTFSQGLIVQLNAQDPSRLDVLFDPILVGGLRILAVLTQFYLSSAAAQQAAAAA